MRRAVALDDSVRTLCLSYTYTLLERQSKKTEAREQLGKMASEIVKVMRDELLRESVIAYLRTVGYTQQECERIINGPSEGSNRGTSS